MDPIVVATSDDACGLRYAIGASGGYHIPPGELLIQIVVITIAAYTVRVKAD